MNGNLVNGLGLIADIIGALLVWRFGLPEPISRAGVRHLIAEDSDEAEIATPAMYDRWSHLGIALLVLGFALQLLSDWIR